MSEEPLRKVMVLRQVEIPWAALRKGDVFRTLPASPTDSYAESEVWNVATTDVRDPLSGVMCDRVDLQVDIRAKQTAAHAKDTLPKRLGTNPTPSELLPPGELAVPLHGTQWYGDSPCIAGGAQIIVESVDQEALDLRNSQVKWLTDGRAKTVFMFGQGEEGTGLYLQPPTGEMIRISTDKAKVRFV